MKKIISNAGYYEVSIPDTWVFEKTDNLITIFAEQHAAGALQISSYLVANDYQMNLRTELAEVVAEHLGKRIEAVEKDIFVDERAVFIRLVETDSYWEYRMMFEKQVLLLITYNCMFEDAAREEKQISEIIKTIALFGKKEV